MRLTMFFCYSRSWFRLRSRLRTVVRMAPINAVRRTTVPAQITVAATIPSVTKATTPAAVAHRIAVVTM